MSEFSDRCGTHKRHLPHWHERKWCDGKPPYDPDKKKD